MSREIQSEELKRQIKQAELLKKKREAEVLSFVEQLRDYGFIPKDVKAQFSRGGDEHTIVGKIWDAANQSGRVYDQLKEALKQELVQNKEVMDEIKRNPPKSADRPCGGKRDLIDAAIKALENENDAEMANLKKMTVMSAAGFVARGAAGLAAQGVRATLPTWVSEKVVGPAPPKVESKPRTLTDIAAQAGNKKALNFQTALKAHNAASSADAKAAARTADAKSSAPPSPGPGRSQD